MPAIPKPKLPTQIADYTILTLTIPLVPSYPHQSTHYLYLRPHAPKLPDNDTPRSLFLANVPIDATHDNIKKLFADQLGGGRVVRVVFEGVHRRGGAAGERGVVAGGAGGSRESKGKKRKRGQDAEEVVRAAKLPGTWDREVLKSGSCAVVVFVDRASAEMAVRECKKAAKQGREVVWRVAGEGLGVERYTAHHTLRYPSRSTLQSTINTYLTAYAALEATRSRHLAQQRSVPDAEGFITVTRGGRVGPARVEQAQEAAERAKEREKKRVGGDFYRFQTRERRKEREAELRRGFEKDRRRMEEMRRRRGVVRPE